MSGYYGYGFYDEEETGGITTGGLLTGGAARAKKAYEWTKVPTGKVGITLTGKRVPIFKPQRVRMSIEGATKMLYNKQLQEKNRWFQVVRADKTLADLRKQVGARMRELSQAYLAELKDKDPAKFEKTMKAKEKRKTKAERQKDAAARLEEFKRTYPTAEQALDVIRRSVPNRRAAVIALKVIYGLTDEQINKMLPRRRRFAAIFSPGEVPAPTPAPVKTPEVAPVLTAAK
jgi:hypothetical protein